MGGSTNRELFPVILTGATTPKQSLPRSQSSGRILPLRSSSARNSPRTGFTELVTEKKVLIGGKQKSNAPFESSPASVLSQESVSESVGSPVPFPRFEVEDGQEAIAKPASTVENEVESRPSEPRLASELSGDLELQKSMQNLAMMLNQVQQEMEALKQAVFEQSRQSISSAVPDVGGLSTLKRWWKLLVCLTTIAIPCTAMAGLTIAHIGLQQGPPPT